MYISPFSASPNDVMSAEVSRWRTSVEPFAAIDEATGHGAVPTGVRVLGDRVRERLAGAGDAGAGVGEGVEPLAAVPPVVAVAAAGRLPIDLLVRALADVGDPQRTRGALEAGPPRIAQADIPDRPAERVARIRESAAQVRGDAEDLAEERGRVLAVFVGIASTAAVAGKDVEIAIGPVQELATVVVRSGVRNREER